jgi:hypothetical protein
VPVKILSPSEYARCPAVWATHPRQVLPRLHEQVLYTSEQGLYSASSREGKTARSQGCQRLPLWPVQYVGSDSSPLMPSRKALHSRGPISLQQEGFPVVPMMPATAMPLARLRAVGAALPRAGS